MKLYEDTVLKRYSIFFLFFSINLVPVPYMDTLRKMHFFHSRIDVLRLQKRMTTIPGLLTTFKKISNLVNVLVLFK